MQNLIAIGVGLVAVLFICLWVLERKLKVYKKSLDRARAEAQEAHRNMELIRGKLTQVQNVNLDLSGIESEVEENTQQIVSYLRQELGSLDEDLRDLVERVDELGELEERVSELETKLEGVEVDDEEEVIVKS